ncbi:MAG TPA: hypothetical protein VFX96_11805 [Pyrinomonadaceae bacterium]|nr:hypothetical protein [Pyrinomonadaceae bacterium]
MHDLSFILSSSAFAFDAGGPLLFLALGVFALVVVVLIIAVEAVALRLLKWGGFGRALLDSFLMNLVSTVIGVPLLFGYATIFGETLGVRYVFAFALSFVISAAIEGGVLLALRRRPSRETWRAAVISNAASYAAVTLLMVALAVAGN